MSSWRDVASIQHVKVLIVVDPQDGSEMVVVFRVVSQFDGIGPGFGAGIVRNDVGMSRNIVFVGLVHDIYRVVVGKCLGPHPHVEDHLFAAVVGEVFLCVVHHKLPFTSSLSSEQLVGAPTIARS
jgi:hypothetical protein